jgi:hypothetical protein
LVNQHLDPASAGVLGAVVQALLDDPKACRLELGRERGWQPGQVDRRIPALLAGKFGNVAAQAPAEAQLVELNRPQRKDRAPQLENLLAQRALELLQLVAQARRVGGQPVEPQVDAHALERQRLGQPVVNIARDAGAFLGQRALELVDRALLARSPARPHHCFSNLSANRFEQPQLVGRQARLVVLVQLEPADRRDAVGERERQAEPGPARRRKVAGRPAAADLVGGIARAQLGGLVGAQAVQARHHWPGLAL